MRIKVELAACLLNELPSNEACSRYGCGANKPPLCGGVGGVQILVCPDAKHNEGNRDGGNEIGQHAKQIEIDLRLIVRSPARPTPGITRCAHNARAVQDCVYGEALRLLTAEDAAGWFASCGHPVH